MPGPLEAAVVLAVVLAVVPRRQLLAVGEELVAVLRQRRLAVVREAEVARGVVAAVPVAVPIPHTTRYKTSRLDRGASGPTAPRRS